MKRIFQRKVRLASCHALVSEAATVEKECLVRRGTFSSLSPVKTLGIALSVAASSLAFIHHDDKALAANGSESLSLARSLETFDKAGLEQSGKEAPLSDGESAVRDADVVHQVRSPQSVSTPVNQPHVVNHVVREGDTLWNISKLYDVAPGKIASANGLKMSDVLRIGQTLKVPSSGAVDSESIVSNSETNSTHRLSNLNLAQLQVRQVASSSIRTPQSARSSLVSPGEAIVEDPDTIRHQAIARLRSQREQLATSLSEIQTEWQLQPTVSKGLKTYEETPEVSHTVGLEDDTSVGDVSLLQVPSDLNSSEDGSGTSQILSYQLVRGDTLASIAQEHGISLQALIDANSIRNPNRVFVGQTIRIPVTRSESAVQNDVSEGLSISDSNSIPQRETLISALTSSSAGFGISGQFEFSSAPSVPLPTGFNQDDIELDGESEDLNGSLDNTEIPQESVHSTEEADSVPSESIEADESDGSEPSTHVYVENLIEDIDEISETSPSPNESALLQELERVSQDVAIRSNYRPDQEYIQRGNAVNPQFQGLSSDIELSPELPEQDVSSSADVTSSTDISPSTDEELVAFAPIGSENYSPLSQPITGRIVSPELPPLPGSENFIPNGEATFNGYAWPARGTLTSGYGWRWGRMHQGIDIAAPVGTPIFASAPGVIEFSGWNSGGYGNMVDIRHPDGSKTRYAHNSRNLVREGQQVTQGQQIAEMGSTGYSTGPHLHFEIHKPSGVMNPIALLPSR